MVRNAIAGLLIVGVGVSLLAAEGPGKTVWNFDHDTAGKLPPGFSEQAGSWKVVESQGKKGLVQLAKSPDKTFNIVLIDKTNAKDLDISVTLRPIDGEIDRGGGLVWRARDARNYYIARYNPLESNVRVYKVEGGKRTQLDHADAPGDKGWHTLRITMSGREIFGYLDGKKLLVAEDSTFAEAGKIGLWTKADARTEFDELILEPR
jgi:hypothetical protein